MKTLPKEASFSSFQRDLEHVMAHKSLRMQQLAAEAAAQNDQKAGGDSNRNGYKKQGWRLRETDPLSMTSCNIEHHTSGASEESYYRLVLNLPATNKDREQQAFLNSNPATASSATNTNDENVFLKSDEVKVKEQFRHLGTRVWDCSLVMVEFFRRFLFYHNADVALRLRRRLLHDPYASMSCFYQKEGQNVCTQDQSSPRASYRCQNNTNKPPYSILELGAGTGLLSIALCKMLRHCHMSPHMIAADMGGPIVDHLTENVRNNGVLMEMDGGEEHERGGGGITCVALDWYHACHRKLNASPQLADEQNNLSSGSLPGKEPQETNIKTHQHPYSEPKGGMPSHTTFAPSQGKSPSSNRQPTPTFELILVSDCTLTPAESSAVFDLLQYYANPKYTTVYVCACTQREGFQTFYQLVVQHCQKQQDRNCQVLDPSCLYVSLQDSHDDQEEVGNGNEEVIEKDEKKQIQRCLSSLPSLPAIALEEIPSKDEWPRYVLFKMVF